MRFDLFIIKVLARITHTSLRISLVLLERHERKAWVQHVKRTKQDVTISQLGVRLSTERMKLSVKRDDIFSNEVRTINAMKNHIANIADDFTALLKESNENKQYRAL